MAGGESRSPSLRGQPRRRRSLKLDDFARGRQTLYGWIMARRTLEIEPHPRNEGRPASRAAWLALLACCVATWLAGCNSRTESQPQAPAASSAPDQLPPLEHPPLDPPLRITATFGEFRRAHFHAGTDFSTEHHIGK